MVARILLWSLSDSKTTVAELRHHLVALAGDGVWISDEATERFGLISFSEEPPDVGWIRDVIGKDPEVGEQFDVEEP